MASCKYDPTFAGAAHPYVVLNVTQQSQNIAAKKSIAAYELLIYRPSKIYSDAAKAYNITINGVKVKNTTTTIGGSGTKSIASGTVEIPHNADGSKSITFSFSIALDIKWNGIQIGTGSANGSMTLSTIPRASSFGAISGDTIGSNITVNINRASGAFTHQLWYRIGNSGWFDLGTNIATSKVFAPPLSLCSQTPNSTTATMELCVRTYNGSTRIGNDVYKNISVKVPSNILPTVSTITAIETVAGIAEKFKGYVKTKSKIKVTIAAAGIYGSTIKNYSTKIDGKTYAGATFTTDAINTSGTVSISTTVQDSRGRTASKKIDISVLDYISPTINAFSAVRTDASGTPNEDGEHALITLDFAISSVNSLNDNSYKVEYKEKNSETWLSLGSWKAYQYKGTLNGGAIFNVDSSYALRLTLTDYFGSVTAIYDKVGTSFTLVDFNKSGNSISFGGASERAENVKAVDFKMEAFDMFGTRINNGLARYTGIGDEAIDPNTTIDELVLTDKNVPINGFMYVTTVFYGDKTPTSNRAQSAIPYSTNDAVYYRRFFNGIWSEWKTNSTATGVITGINSIPIYWAKSGNQVSISIDAKMNKIPYSGTWNGVLLTTLPVNLRPAVKAMSATMLDGDYLNTVPNFLLEVRTNGDVWLVSRRLPIDWSKLGDGHGCRAYVSYPTL